MIEAICPEYGCHVALTGGCLYKDGPRKDLDLVFYRIRHVPEIDVWKLLEELKNIGFSKVVGGGWRYVAQYEGKTVDLLFPDIQA
jgi:hypothetical protein